MGNGNPPAGVDLDIAPPIDDGTSARIGSPTPGPIGLDARNSGGSQTAPSMAEQIVNFARRKHGTVVGDGQCFALADQALRGANAKSAADYGTITPNANYEWGTSVTLGSLQPGDVIQFRNYKFKKVVVTHTSSQTVTEELEGTRPHHTAVVETVDGDGAVTVLEQNIPEGTAVTRAQLYLTAGTTTSGNRTTTITLRGTFRFFRPEAR